MRTLPSTRIVVPDGSSSWAWSVRRARPPLAVSARASWLDGLPLFRFPRGADHLAGAAGAREVDGVLLRPKAPGPYWSPAVNASSPSLVLVIGAARGVDRALCRRLAARGVKLVLAGSNADTLAALASEVHGDVVRLDAREFDVVGAACALRRRTPRSARWSREPGAIDRCRRRSRHFRARLGGGHRHRPSHRVAPVFALAPLMVRAGSGSVVPRGVRINVLGLARTPLAARPMRLEPSLEASEDARARSHRSAGGRGECRRLAARPRPAPGDHAGHRVEAGLSAVRARGR